ncbi:MAG: hypothetical protein ACI4X9_02245 [Kiritimatiellia bacterium]
MTIEMTENRRIFWNIVATYGRSLFALCCGLLTGRWVLMSLGEVDYGLYGVVGGLAVFVSFFNSVLASAIGRFYTVSVGQAKVATDEKSALEECRAWFNTAVSIHTVVPLVLVAVGYPIGEWAIRSFLQIPIPRIDACVWAFRFVCVSCFVGMLNVPFQAMYTAKQYIAELTIYNFAATSLNVGFLCFMVNHPGDWMVKYAAWMCLLSVIPQVIICFRAMRIFPECKIKRGQMFRWSRFRQLGAFAGWQMVGTFSGLLRGQGIAILVNKFFGPRVNAALTVANTVNGQSSTLSGAMLSAFSPAILTAYGARDFARMEKLVFMACKFGVLLSFIFVAPLLLELDVVLRLWLKNPPAFTTGLTALFLISHLLENLTYGHMIAVNASGQIAAYHTIMGSFSLLALPLAFVFAIMGGSPYSVVCAILITQAAYTVARIFLARRIVALPIRKLIEEVAIPILILGVVTLVFGSLPRWALAASFSRVCLTTLCCEAVILPLTWYVLMSNDERLFFSDRAWALLRKELGR